MFDLVTPTRRDIYLRQDRESAFYFSAVADLVVRKHGYVDVVAGPHSVGGLPIWCRGVMPGDEATGVSEAPSLDAHPWGVKGEPRSSKALDLYDSSGARLGKVTYPRFNIRRIPEARGVISDPELHESRDPRWDVDEFTWSALDPRPPWETVAWAAPDDGGPRVPVAASDASRLLLGLPLLDVLAATHAFAPIRVGYYTTARVSSQLGAERWLVSQLARHAIAAGHEVTRVDPWPAGKRSALTVRHDYDRVVEPEILTELLDEYDRLGVRSTWCFRLDNLEPAHAQLVADRGHEVALHTIAANYEAFEEEVHALSDAVGAPVMGVTAHGGIGSTGFLGMRQHVWSAAAGLSYGEMLGRTNGLPHAAVRLSRNRPEWFDLVLPATHLSLDQNMSPEGHHLEVLARRVPEDLEAGMHAVVMNHPDIHRKQLLELLRGLDLSATWCATLAEIAEWTRAATLASTFDRQRCSVAMREDTPEDLRVTRLTAGGQESYIVPRIAPCGTTAIGCPPD